MKNGWMDLVMETKNQNPGLAFKEVLKVASKSYNKQSGLGFKSKGLSDGLLALRSLRDFREKLK